MIQADDENHGVGSGRYAAVFWLMVWFASSGFFQRNGGMPGLAISLAVVAAGGWLWYRFGEIAVSWVRARPRTWIALAAILLTVVFVFGYAWEDGKGPGKSSDRDDGLNIAVSRLVTGESPYYPDHPMAGPLSVLPGAVFLATPFAVAGNSAWQNLFWLAVFFAVSLKFGACQGRMLVLLGCLFALCPALLYEWISGGDMIANGIYVLLALVMYLRVWGGRSPALWALVASALFLGVALASRMNFLLVLPILGTAVWRVAGFARAAIGVAAVCAVFAAVTLPFYLADPDGFTPLIAGDKLGLVNQHVPWGGAALKTLSAMVAVAAGLALFAVPSRRVSRAVLPLTIIVLLAPMVAMVAMQSWISGLPDFGFMHPRYALMALFAAIWAWGCRVHWWGTQSYS